MLERLGEVYLRTMYHKLGLGLGQIHSD